MELAAQRTQRTPISVADSRTARLGPQIGQRKPRSATWLGRSRKTAARKRCKISRDGIGTGSYCFLLRSRCPLWPALPAEHVRRPPRVGAAVQYPVLVVGDDGAHRAGEPGFVVPLVH